MGLIGLWLYDKFFLGVTWLSGWVPIVLAIAVISFLRSKKLFLILVIILVIVVLVSFNWWTEVFAAENAESGNRFDKWEFLFLHHSTLGHWFLGTGPFGNAQYFITYFPNNSASTQNNYIDIFLQFGIIGFLAFIWMLGAIAWEGYKLHTTKIGDGFIAGFVNGSIGAFVGVVFAMTLGDWFTPFVLNQGLHAFAYTVSSWIFFGALCAVPVILKNERLIQGKNSTDA
jgi:hypothetical protein